MIPLSLVGKQLRGMGILSGKANVNIIFCLPSEKGLL